jgi:hypothetical protein
MKEYQFFGVIESEIIRCIHKDANKNSEKKRRSIPLQQVGTGVEERLSNHFPFRNTLVNGFVQVGEEFCMYKRKRGE